MRGYRRDVGRARQRAELERFPRSLAHDATQFSQESGWWQGEIRSPAMGRAVGRLARQLRVSESVVILTLAGMVIGHWFGLDRLYTGVLSANRFTRRLMGAIGTFSQSVPVALEVRGSSFPSLARANYGATLQAYRYSSLSPYAIGDIFEQLAREGHPVTIDSLMNVHVPRVSATANDADRPLERDDDSTFVWNAFRDHEITTLYFESQRPDAAILQTSAKYVPKADLQALLVLYRQLAIHLAGDIEADPAQLLLRLAGREAVTLG